jgi:molybdopterin molybdotransferase
VALTEFLHAISADHFIQLLGNFVRLSSERIPLAEALDRVLFEAIIAREDLPEGSRSTVDGFAVRAEDTFGASDSIPAFLEMAEAVFMGTMPDFELKPGQAAPIPTGGFLPRGADAVVMVEYTNSVGSNSIEVSKPVTVKTNVLEKGEDARSGEILLPGAKKLRSQELGFLAALGISQVAAYRKPRVAILSTGDELVPIDGTPRLGQIRDANSYSIAALARSSGAEPFISDIVPDNADLLKTAIINSLAMADVVVLSGGSSVGTRDLMVDVVSALPGVKILAHGVSIRPGKPVLLASQNGKPIIGLPGHPVSALVVALVFVAPFLQYLQGGKMEKGPLGNRIQATLAASFHSTIGLEEYVRVRVEEIAESSYLVHPIFGKSGMLSTMVKASGILQVPMNAEGFSRGDVVQVVQF